MAVWCKFHCKSSNFGTTATKIWLQFSLPWPAANGRTPIQVTLWEFILGTTQSRCQLIQGLNHWQWETSASLGGFKQLKWRIHGDIWGYNMIKWTFYGSTCFQSPFKRWFLGCVESELGIGCLNIWHDWNGFALHCHILIELQYLSGVRPSTSYHYLVGDIHCIRANFWVFREQGTQTCSGS